MYCIYHSRDLDGWTSAAIVKRWFDCRSVEGGGLTLIGWDYGRPIPDIREGEDVIMVDISFPMREMQAIGLKNKLTWIDHHKSAIADFWREIGDATTFEAYHQEILDQEDMLGWVKVNKVAKKAACELAWEYFFPSEEMPEMLNMLGAYDSFRHIGMENEAHIKMFQYGARARAQSPDEASVFLDHDPNLKSVITSEGTSIFSYLKQEAVRIFGGRTDIVIDGYKFAAVNMPLFNPKNFNFSQNGYDGFMSYSYKGDMWTISLYSDTVDCSVLCKARGGGGHAGAAGFQVSSPGVPLQLALSSVQHESCQP